MIQRVDDISVLHLSGEIDPVDGGRWLKRIQALMKREFSKIVINLGEVDHIHYRFLAELVTLARVSSVMAGGIKLANVTPYHRNIIRFTGVERFFETYDSVAEAILSFPSGNLGSRDSDSCAIH